MIRFALIAAALTLPALPALAADQAGHGALAGRSPHQAYRSAEAAPACVKMHSVPAGKLPVYGTHATGQACAEARDFARADAAKLASRR